jgi:hypothetical protein
MKFDDRAIDDEGFDWGYDRARSAVLASASKSAASKLEAPFFASKKERILLFIHSHDDLAGPGADFDLPSSLE